MVIYNLSQFFCGPNLLVLGVKILTEISIRVKNGHYTCLIPPWANVERWAHLQHQGQDGHVNKGH